MKRRLSIIFAIMMALLLAFPIGPTAFADEEIESQRSLTEPGEEPIDPQREVIDPSYEVYYRNGNKIVDEYGLYSYDGYKIPYRVIKISPWKATSKLIFSSGKVSISAKTAFKAGAKNLIKIIAQNGISKVPLVSTVYDAYKKISGVTSAFSTSTIVKDATGTMLVAANKTVVYVYMYWSGLWRKVYEGDYVSGTYNVGATAFIESAHKLIVTSLNGSYSVGTASYNLRTCCYYVTKYCGLVHFGDKVTSYTVQGLNQSLTINTCNPDILSLGAKQFKEGTILYY